MQPSPLPQLSGFSPVVIGASSERGRADRLAPLGGFLASTGSGEELILRPLPEPHPHHVPDRPFNPVHAGVVAHGGTAVIKTPEQNIGRPNR